VGVGVPVAAFHLTLHAIRGEWRSWNARAARYSLEPRSLFSLSTLRLEPQAALAFWGCSNFKEDL